VIFLVNVVFEQERAKTSIMFKVQNTINILRFFVILNNNRFTKFLALFKQRIDNNVIIKSSIKNEINFHKCEKLEFNN